MPLKCDRCKGNAIIFLRYSGQHLCEDHFLDLLRRRVRKEARSQNVLKRGPRIGLALSGGKDSLVALRLLSEIVGPMANKEIVAITIDEGITGYRPSSIDISKKITRELDIEWRSRSYKNLFGMELDEMVRRSELGPCSICGILRRKSLNQAAIEAECDILVTGHNLDDVAQTVIMNVVSADLKRLVRMGPHLEPIEGFVPRGMILRTTPETETYLSAHLLGLPVHDVECPYAVNAQRGNFRDIILKLESDTPGSRHSLLRFHEQVTSIIPRNIPNSSRCVKCSEPVVNSGAVPICRACKLLFDLGAIE